VTTALPDRLLTAAALRGFRGGPESLEKVVRFLEAVLEASRNVNLTGAESLDEAIDVLALSSFAVGAAWQRPAPPRLAVDLGSGNGFPGVVAALHWPSARVWLVERRAKKAAAVAACLAAVGIENAETIACDGRDLLRERPQARGAVDLVTARAVGSVAEVNRIGAPWLAPQGRIAHWKGENLAEAERAEAGREARGLGLRLAADLDLRPVPPGPARFVVYERSAS
jgi:16S rRNA (guanine527-N7)-methyltransferase